MSASATREQIIDAADMLFYARGFEHTSFADIAGAVNISRGNFYYHFRTKDEILEAVIGRRLASTGQMLNDWETQASTPEGRIGCFIDLMVLNRAKIKRHGCPVGTLCAELARLEHPAQPEAKRLVTLFRVWLRQQFQAMGREADADGLAMHLLTRSQGIATMASVFRDERLIKAEVARLHDWLRAQMAGHAGGHPTTQRRKKARQQEA